MSSVTDRCEEIGRAMDAACARAGRPAGSVRLVGASKLQPVARLREAWTAGLRTFGENRVQEVVAKSAEMPPEVDWHLIGPLQSNKVKLAVAHCSTIQSVDRLKIAHAIDRAADAAGRRIVGFLEINIGREASKHGFDPDDIAEVAAPLAELEHLRIVGVMGIPPYEADRERSRSWFRRLREIRDALFARPAWADREGFLSMGMSHDFEVAIEEGATHVRIGTALFGPRD